MKTITRTALFAGALLAGGACSPQSTIEAIFSDVPGQATTIATCESTMNPYAVSSTNDHGLFQINAVHRADFEAVTGLPWSSVYSAYWNTKFARHLYDQQGWGPWTCRKAL